jgi:hypothetical protein
LEQKLKAPAFNNRKKVKTMNNEIINDTTSLMEKPKIGFLKRVANTPMRVYDDLIFGSNDYEAPSTGIYFPITLTFNVLYCLFLNGGLFLNGDWRYFISGGTVLSIPLIIRILFYKWKLYAKIPGILLVLFLYNFFPCFFLLHQLTEETTPTVSESAVVYDASNIVGKDMRLSLEMNAGSGNMILMADGTGFWENGGAKVSWTLEKNDRGPMLCVGNSCMDIQDNGHLMLNGNLPVGYIRDVVAQDDKSDWHEMADFIYQSSMPRPSGRGMSRGAQLRKD